MIRSITIFAAIQMVLASGLFAQNQSPEILSLDEAVRIGLENNFSISIARNDADIAANNQSYGNAGFLPELSATASRTKRIEDSKTEFSGESIPDRDVDGAETTTTNASASLNWTIFDGLGMFTTYNKLTELKELGAIESRLAIENNIAQIITAYFNIVRQQVITEVLESTLQLSEQRIQIAETRKDLGSGSEYDLLQARADYNADRAAAIRQEITLHDSKILLNELMGRDVEQEFGVQADIPVNQELEYDEIIEKALAGNLQLAVAKTNERVTELEIREIRAERFPELDLNVGYGYNLNESGAGFLELSQSTGFNYGLTARITLFDGFNRERRRQNAQIALKNQRLSFQQQEQQVKAGINAEFNSYLNALRLVELEEENLVYAEQTVEIALERFKLGTINSIELREAQRTLIDAESRLIQARYEAKAAETELYRLMGIVTEQAAD